MLKRYIDRKKIYFFVKVHVVNNIHLHIGIKLSIMTI